MLKFIRILIFNIFYYKKFGVENFDEYIELMNVYYDCLNSK